MGNLCCKRQKHQPHFESVRYSLDEKHTTDNNLKLYLNDVYEKECVLKASQEEVEFIQTGIETLVQDIVDEALEIFSTNEEIKHVYNTEEWKSEISKYFESDLIDVYFPIKKDSYYRDLTDIKPTKCSIIKVGSFYEGTKNNFLDEFDFIFLLFCWRDTLHDFSRFINTAVSSCIHSVIKRKSFHYSSPNYGTREIYLNTGKNIELHGPAITLKFIYTNGSTEKRHIAVDLVPAYKTVFDNKPDWYVKYVDRYIKPKSFHDEIMSAENCFVVKRSSGISFTKTEVSFISNVLSKHHVKVYRILKFLINGHGDDETMRYCLLRYNLSLNSGDGLPYKPYSSYQIKTMMIYHHDECRNSDTTDIGPCVLQVLGEICKYKIRYPVFSPISYELQYLVDYLQSLIDTLKSMQTRTDGYSYEGYKMKSVTMQFLEREHLDWLEHVNRFSSSRLFFFD